MFNKTFIRHNMKMKVIQSKLNKIGTYDFCKIFLMLVLFALLSSRCKKSIKSTQSVESSNVSKINRIDNNQA